MTRVGAVFRIEHISDLSQAAKPTTEVAEEIKEALMKIPGTLEVNVEELYEPIKAFKKDQNSKVSQSPTPTMIKENET